MNIRTDQKDQFVYASHFVLHVICFEYCKGEIKRYYHVIKVLVTKLIEFFVVINCGMDLSTREWYPANIPSVSCPFWDKKKSSTHRKIFMQSFFTSSFEHPFPNIYADFFRPVRHTFCYLQRSSFFRLLKPIMRLTALKLMNNIYFSCFIFFWDQQHGKRLIPASSCQFCISVVLACTCTSAVITNS